MEGEDTGGAGVVVAAAAEGTAAEADPEAFKSFTVTAAVPVVRFARLGTAGAATATTAAPALSEVAEVAAEPEPPDAGSAEEEVAVSVVADLLSFALLLFFTEAAGPWLLLPPDTGTVRAALEELMFSWLASAPASVESEETTLTIDTAFNNCLCFSSSEA